jgi:hypothetical protein
MIPSKNTISTNAKFAQEVYKAFLNRKHGIGSCCGVELDRYYTKKENCDLAHRILDGYCMAEPVIPIAPDCPVECIEGSYATAYFNLIGLSYPIITVDPPSTYINITSSLLSVPYQYEVDRSQVYSFSSADISVFIQDFNETLVDDLIPFTLSFTETIPGAMGYGLVLTSNDKTNIYNDITMNIELTNLGSAGDYYDLNFESTISGGVVSTC